MQNILCENTYSSYRTSLKFIFSDFTFVLYNFNKNISFQIFDVRFQRKETYQDYHLPLKCISHPLSILHLEQFARSFKTFQGKSCEEQFRQVYINSRGKIFLVLGFIVFFTTLITLNYCYVRIR